MPKRRRARPIVVPAKPPKPAKPPNSPQPPNNAKADKPKPLRPPRPPNSRDVRLAESRCWDPDESFKPGWSSLTIASAQQLAALRHHHPLALEVARGKSLHSLRVLFGEQLQNIGLLAADDRSSPVVGAFERWHFGWLLAAAATRPAGSDRFDPLLPAVQAPEADATLQAELMLKRREQEGASARDAAAVVGNLRRAADNAAAAIADGLSALASARVEDDPVVIELAPAGIGDGGGSPLWHVTARGSALWSGGALKISDEHLTKLRDLHARTSRAAGTEETPTTVEAAHEEERRFRIALVALLLRYKSIGGSGFQAALGGGAFAALRACFGVEVECFASPLNVRTAPFCSAFPDVDLPFGSCGTFADASASMLRGAYEANPPFVPTLILQMCERMHELLRQAEAQREPLLFLVVVGSSAQLRRHEAWEALQRLCDSEFGRARWLLPVNKHGYTEGHAHLKRGGAVGARKRSSCETAVLVYATSAGALRWPARPKAFSALQDAMKGANVPRKRKSSGERKVGQQGEEEPSAKRHRKRKRPRAPEEAPAPKRPHGDLSSSRQLESYRHG